MKTGNKGSGKHLDDGGGPLGGGGAGPLGGGGAGPLGGGGAGPLGGGRRCQSTLKRIAKQLYELSKAFEALSEMPIGGTPHHKMGSKKK